MPLRIGFPFLAWKVTGFAIFNIGLVVVWLVVAVAIGRRYKVLVKEGRPPA